MGIDLRKVFVVLAVVTMAGVLYFAGFNSVTGGRTSAASVYAARLSPQLTSQIAGLEDAASVGVAIVSFNASNGLTAANLDVLRGVGISSGVTYNKLGMVGAVLTAGQVKALARTRLSARSGPTTGCSITSTPPGWSRASTRSAPTQR